MQEVNSCPAAGILTGFPSGDSSAKILSGAVTGDEISFYRIKIGTFVANDCSNATDYSITRFSSDAPITNNISDLSDGTITVCVVGIDDSGVQQPFSSATIASWTKDTTAPSAPAILSSANNTDVAGVIYTNNLKFAISGTAEANATVMLYNGEMPLGTATANEYGAWTLTPSDNLSTGAYTITAKATDAALNQSAASTTIHVFLDTTAPAAPNICRAGNYPSDGSCAVVGTGYYSTDGLTRLPCGTIPSNASYSTDNSTTATCPWSCNVNYLLNADQTGCDYPLNTQAVSCPDGQVIVGAAVRSGGWMDNLGVRCKTFTDGALTGDIIDGSAYGGGGGWPYTFDCPAGYYLYRITGGNGAGSSTTESTYLANITFYCRSLTTDLPATAADTSGQYGYSPGITKFDYSCAVSKPITSILIEPINSYVGRIPNVICGSNLK